MLIWSKAFLCLLNSFFSENPKTGIFFFDLKCQANYANDDFKNIFNQFVVLDAKYLQFAKCWKNKKLATLSWLKNDNQFPNVWKPIFTCKLVLYNAVHCNKINHNEMKLIRLFIFKEWKIFLSKNYKCLISKQISWSCIEYFQSR